MSAALSWRRSVGAAAAVGASARQARLAAPRAAPAQRHQQRWHPHQQQQRPGAGGRPAVTAHARPSDKDAAAAPEATGVAKLVGTPIYTALEVGELLLILMLIDAAFSGDWSRIGVISTDTELVLQKISAFVVTAHLGTGAAAGLLASRKGKSPLLPAVKGFLFGALGVYEEQYSP